MNKLIRNLQPYAAYLLAWLALELVFLVQSVGRRLYLGDPNPWQDIAYWSVSVAIFSLLTPLIVWSGNRFPLDKSNWPRIASLHLLIAVSIGLIKALLGTIVYQLFPILYAPQPVLGFNTELGMQIIYGIHTSTIAYWMLIGIQLVHRNYVRYQERTKEALRLQLNAAQLHAQITNARLSALKAQLQPHFLFNTLNAIIVLVRQQRGALAEATLERFSDLLRAVLVDIEAQEVTLARELEYIQLYLSIEQLRFSDKLGVILNIEPEVLEALVPHMSLQPLVENAIRHGVERRTTAGKIEIHAFHENDQLHISIQDNGPGFGTSPGTGIGLANTRSRLSQLYGEAAQLHCETLLSGGARVTLTLPYCAIDTLHSRKSVNASA